MHRTIHTINNAIFYNFQGFIYPSLNALLAKWAPLEERGRLGSLVFAGMSLCFYCYFSDPQPQL